MSTRKSLFFSGQSNTPAWVVFLVDMGLTLFSLGLAYLLRFNFDVPAVEIVTFPLVFSTVLGIRAASFLLAGTHIGIIRYTSTQDVQRLFVVVSLGSLLFGLINFFTGWVFSDFYLIPFSIIMMEYFITNVFVIGLRIGVKVLYFELKSNNSQKTNVLIFGAGDSGIITKRTLDRDGTTYRVLAFLDEQPSKVGKKIEGIRIYSLSNLAQILEKNEVDQMIISIQNLDRAKIAEVVKTCLEYQVKVLNVPPVNNWINGELSFKQIKTVRIEDLLGREPIQLDADNIRGQFMDKVILVTGGAGSIGREIVQQVAQYQPKKLVLLDQAESDLYELELEIKDGHPQLNFEVVIGNIRSRERLANVYRSYRPQVVFHAAAYKHVPLMEDNPSEAVQTNVLGTRNLVDLAEEFGVERFVMVSTDKAVNPTNVMGASKRIAEIYCQARNQHSTTRFITTRFGNVLDSSGSVIPLFRKQIEKGGPVKVTHPEITRFFMTIPEACQLVLEAGAMGKGGEIFIFDMGSSVKILDLAKQMIQLSGLELGRDIEIEFTGLRPGEKLYEELLADKETTIPTHHPQIMIAKVATYDLNAVAQKIDALIGMYNQQDNESIVAQMKEIVPEYRSHNSVYSKLDA